MDGWVWLPRWEFNGISGIACVYVCGFLVHGPMFVFVFAFLFVLNLGALVCLSHCIQVSFFFVTYHLHLIRW